MPITNLPNGKIRIPLDEISDYLAANGLEITGPIGASWALTCELAPVESNLPPTISPAWFGLDAADRDARLAEVGYRIVRVQRLRDGSWLFDLEPTGATHEGA